MKVMLESCFPGVPSTAQLADDIFNARRGWTVCHSRPEFVEVEVNPDATRAGVSEEPYHGYRKGNVGACADTVLVRGGPNVAVPMIYRSRPPFGKTWWIMGGAVHNFRPIHNFLLFKALTEGGIVQVPEHVRGNGIKTATWFYDYYKLDSNTWSLEGVTMVGSMGFFRTPAEDQTDGRVCDTMQPCYLGLLSPGVEVWHDKDHESVKWFDRSQLAKTDMHWYPKLVATRALEAYANAL